MHQFPTLYGKDKHGKIRVWKASVHSNETNGVIVIQHGVMNGQLQEETRIVKVGKNIGKKNETTPLQQAINETERRWLDKRDKDLYTESIQNIMQKDTMVQIIKPMLAHTLEFTQGKNCSIVFPCFVQPKLDGVRCLVYRTADGRVVAQSRTGTIFNSVSHITDDFASFFQTTHQNIVFDGELYTTNIPFETLAGLIRKQKIRPEDKEQLCSIRYHIYDMIDRENCDMPFHLRYTYISEHVPGNFPHCVLVSTENVGSKDKFMQCFQEYIAQGYEGIMARKGMGIYHEDERSSDLLKYKEFQEDEFEIVGFNEGTGRDVGTVIWDCKTREGRVFSVRPSGSLEQRREWLNCGDNCIGQMLTVKFQELTEYGVPRFPVGKAIRNGY